jgi:hypothetical protein
LKLLLFGPWGTGKTYTITGLLRLGYTVYVLCTDLGGEGLHSVRAALTASGEGHLLDRLYYIELQGFQDVYDFLQAPERYDPDIFTRAEDVVLFWDGFSNFQAQDVMAYVGEEATSTIQGASDLRQEGFQLEMKDWNAVRNATLRALHLFFGLRGPARAWHKIVTCQEAVRQKQRPGAKPTDPAVMVDERRPMLAGQGGVLAGAGFDVIVETRVRTTRDADDAEREYVYVTGGSDLIYAKTRGVSLPPVMPADPVTLWTTLCSQLGIPLPARADSTRA